MQVFRMHQYYKIGENKEYNSCSSFHYYSVLQYFIYSVCFANILQRYNLFLNYASIPYVSASDVVKSSFFG